MIKPKFFGGFFRRTPKKVVKPSNKIAPSNSMPTGAGNRFKGGMTSGRNMPTSLSPRRRNLGVNKGTVQTNTTNRGSGFGASTLNNRNTRKKRFGSINRISNDPVIRQQQLDRVKNKLNQKVESRKASQSNRLTRRRSSATLSRNNLNIIYFNR